MMFELNEKAYLDKFYGILDKLPKNPTTKINFKISADTADKAMEIINKISSEYDGKYHVTFDVDIKDCSDKDDEDAMNNTANGYQIERI